MIRAELKCLSSKQGRANVDMGRNRRGNSRTKVASRLPLWRFQARKQRVGTGGEKVAVHQWYVEGITTTVEGDDSAAVQVLGARRWSTDEIYLRRSNGW